MDENYLTKRQIDEVQSPEKPTRAKKSTRHITLRTSTAIPTPESDPFHAPMSVNSATTTVGNLFSSTTPTERAPHRASTDLEASVPPPPYPQQRPPQPEAPQMSRAPINIMNANDDDVMMQAISLATAPEADANYEQGTTATFANFTPATFQPPATPTSDPPANPPAATAAPAAALPAVPNAPAPQILFTPLPHQGFPIIHLTDATALAYADPKQVDLVNKSISPTKILVHLADDNYREGDLTIRRNIVVRILNSLGYADTLIVPIPLKNAPNRPRTPHASPFVILNMDPGRALQFTSQCCWSSPQGTIFAHQLPLAISDFALNLDGIIAEASNNNTSVILGDVREALSSNPMISAFVRTHCGGTPHEAAMENLLSSTSVTGRTPPGDNAPTVWSVFIRSPASSPESHTQWLELLQYIKVAGHFGNAKSADIRPCRLCRSVSHERSLCEFPQIPGWNEQIQLTLTRAQPTDLLNSQNRNARGRGRGQQFRGAGRPRGGGRRARGSF